MPANADSVVVELIAQNDKFNADVKASAATYQQSMGQIETAATSGERAHGRLTASVGNSRIAMLEFQHIARGTADQLAAGAPLTQALAQHMGMLAQAVSLAGGTFGAAGEVLAGPWGLAMTAAIAAISILISRHHEEADTLDEVIKKRQKHREEAALNEEADRRWGNTIDGLIEKLNKLNEATGKRLQLPNLTNQQSFSDAQKLVVSLNNLIEKAEADPNSSPQQITDLYTALSKAVLNLRNQTTILGTQVGDVFSDLKKQADDWAQYQENKVRYLTGAHPELLGQTGQIDTAFGLMKKAVEDAAGAGINFDGFTKQVDALNDRLAQSPGYVKSYITELKALAKQLEDVAAAAKIDPIKVFKQNLIGAEGTGANRMGSSAAGIGQFMPATFEHYFSQAYPEQFSQMSRAQVDALRNNKDIAEGVIDTATKDYVSILQSAGQRITAAALYTMHMLSAGDPHGTVALRLLTAPENASARSIVGNAAANANGNIFTGTAAQARAEIARRIGDSSSSVSQGTLAILRTTNEEEKKRQEELTKIENRESEVGLMKEHQVNLVERFNAEQSKTNTLIGQAEIATKDWDAQYQQLVDAQKEFNQFGGHMVDEILNPDNWKNWGQEAKNVLHEILAEIIQLGAANPLKNLLFGQKNPTLSNIFSLFGGKGGGSTSIAGLTDFSGSFGATAGLPHFAGGGGIGVNGGTDNNLLSINGVPRAMVSGDEQLAVIPSGARAASAFGGGGVRVIIGVQANDFFEGKVMSITGPAIAQSSMAAANGGAVISRRNLSREAQHRLE